MSFSSRFAFSCFQSRTVEFRLEFALWFNSLKVVTCLSIVRVLEKGIYCRYSRSFSAVAGSESCVDISFRIFMFRRRRDSYCSLRNAASLSLNYSSISSRFASDWVFSFRTCSRLSCNFCDSVITLTRSYWIYKCSSSKLNIWTCSSRFFSVVSSSLYRRESICSWCSVFLPCSSKPRASLSWANSVAPDTSASTPFNIVSNKALDESGINWLSLAWLILYDKTVDTSLSFSNSP